MDVIISIATAWLIVSTIQRWEQWYYPRAGRRSFYRSQRQRAKDDAKWAAYKRSLGY